MQGPEQKGELIQFLQSPAAGCKFGYSQYKPHSKTKEQLLCHCLTHLLHSMSGKEKAFSKISPNRKTTIAPSSRGVFITTQVKHTHLTCRVLPLQRPPRLHLPAQLSQYKRRAIGFYVSGQQRLKELKQGLSLPMADGAHIVQRVKYHTSVVKIPPNSAASIPSQPSYHHTPTTLPL